MRNSTIINLFGGPGTGKSTIASGIFYKMKKLDYSVEYCQEYAKELTLEERFNIIQEDQLYIFAKQHRRLLRTAKNYDYVIMDSPIILGLAYFDDIKNISNKKIFSDLVIQIFNEYNNINIFIERNDNMRYEEIGRTQKLEEAKSVDLDILNMLDRYGIKYNLIKNNNDVVKNCLSLIK